MRSTSIPPGFEDITPSLSEAHEQMYNKLSARYSIDPYPDEFPRNRTLEGEAASLAHPVQGILKYQGLADWKEHTAFVPSISMGNDSAKTVTVVRFDPSLPEDRVFIDDLPASGHALEKVQQTLHVIRKLSGSSTKAEVISKNLLPKQAEGKGLDLTSSSEASLMLAGIHAAFGETLSRNTRLLSALSRRMSGESGGSITGGISAWLSYPGIPHEDSFAVRLNTKQEFRDVQLFTVPLQSRIELDAAQTHRETMNSPLFKSWLALRKKQMMDALDAVVQRDWEKLGALAELDSIFLQAAVMSSNYGNKIIAWEPETIRLMRIANDMRNKDVPVFYSIDLFPSPVFITHAKHALDVADYLELAKFPDFIEGHIAGPARLLNQQELEQELGGR